MHTSKMQIFDKLVEKSAEDILDTLQEIAENINFNGTNHLFKSVSI